jgi:hypothetical protein
MNIFVLGWSKDGGADPAAAAAALERLLAALPFDLGRGVETWAPPGGRVAAAWASHAAKAVGGVEYAHTHDDSLALFSGRPIAWVDGEADGRSPLDPGYYAGPAEDWASALDGRAAAVSAAPDRLEVWSDPLGSYPLYVLETDNGSWVSNNAELLRDMSGSREMDPTALAGLIGGGWPLDGHPVWSRVRRLAPGLHSFGTDSALPKPRARLGGGLDADAAARTVVDAVRALADWPGRPNVVPVTGGRDSRVVLAAARAAGIDFTATTGGALDDEDVRIGRELARWAGVEHSLIGADPGGDIWSQPSKAASTLMRTSAGTASLADASGFPLSSRPGVLPLWHTGQGGEIGRAYYGARRSRPRAIRELERAFTGHRPGREPPLNARGAKLVRERVEAWADDQLTGGARPRDLADLFYLTRRMGTWAGPSHGAVEWIRDSTSPLWSRAVVQHLLAPSRRGRESERFHREVLGVLAPELLELPLGDGGWRSGSATRRRLKRAARLSRRAGGEVRARVPKRSQPAPTDQGAVAADPFDRIRELVSAAAAGEEHPVFEIVDRSSVEQLLATPSLDTMRRYYVWRLATVLLADIE